MVSLLVREGAQAAVGRTASEREELRRRLMQVRQQRRETPTVVFFSDASYGPSMRGHNAIPKKGILRELCHRGLTFLLDEHKTSKMCGHDELKTTSRAHTKMFLSK